MIATMYLNKDIQLIPHAQIVFESSRIIKIVVMPCVRRRNVCQHAPDVDRRRIIVYRDFGLPYCYIAARVG